MALIAPELLEHISGDLSQAIRVLVMMKGATSDEETLRECVGAVGRLLGAIVDDLDALIEGHKVR